MRCYNCGEKYRKHHGNLTLDDKYIGSYNIVNVDFFKCQNCGKILLPEKTLSKCEYELKRIRDELVRKFPIDEFISSTETARILNISRQALHKHKRIRRGFIYSTKFAGKIFYLKKSVLIFKEKGDGRFVLKDDHQETPEYIVISTKEDITSNINYDSFYEELVISPMPIYKNLIEGMQYIQ